MRPKVQFGRRRQELFGPEARLQLKKMMTRMKITVKPALKDIKGSAVDKIVFRL
jgi:hypothetical protein